MREAQLHGGAAFRAKLLQHDPEPREPLRRIEIAIKCRQRLELLVCRRLVDVYAARLPLIEHRMLLHQIVGHRVEIVDRIADRRLIADPQHPHVHLLRQIRRIGLAADAPQEKRLQGRPTKDGFRSATAMVTHEIHPLSCI